MSSPTNISMIFIGKNNDTFLKCVHIIETNNTFQASVASLSTFFYIDVIFCTLLLPEIFKPKVSNVLKEHGIDYNEFFFVNSDEERAAFQKGVVTGFKMQNQDTQGPKPVVTSEKLESNVAEQSEDVDVFSFMRDQANDAEYGIYEVDIRRKTNNSNWSAPVSWAGDFPVPFGKWATESNANKTDYGNVSQLNTANVTK